MANFWCTSSIIIKWKRLFSVHSLKFISLTATVLTCLPSMIQQVMAPSSRGFLYGLLNSSFAFYFFSFQGKYNVLFFPLVHLLLTLFHVAIVSMTACISNLQYMRSPFCCRFCLLACWLWKSDGLSNG